MNYSKNSIEQHVANIHAKFIPEFSGDQSKIEFARRFQNYLVMEPFMLSYSHQWTLVGTLSFPKIPTLYYLSYQKKNANSGMSICFDVNQSFLLFRYPVLFKHLEKCWLMTQANKKIKCGGRFTWKEINRCVTNWNLCETAHWDYVVIKVYTLLCSMQISPE